MPATTTNLGLTKPYESEYWDIDKFNENMDKIDALTHCIASGTATSDKFAINSGSTKSGTVTWHYKKYSDGTLEAQCSWKVANWKCTDKQGEDGTWRSGYIHVNYPKLGQKAIYYKNAMCASSSSSSDATQCWVMDCSSYGESATYQTIRLVSTKKETSTSMEKVVYMEFKGTWK